MGLWYDCALTWPASQMTRDAEGRVTLDPMRASFSDPVAGDGYCDGLPAAWNAGDEDARRALLSQLRIVQTSFWG